MRVFVFQWILNQTGNDTELTLRPNTYSLNIVQPQPDGPVEPAKYAYTYGVQVVLLFLKSLQLIIITLIYDAVKGWCDKQQLWPARVKGWLQVGFLPGHIHGKLFSEGVLGKAFWGFFSRSYFP